MAEKLSKKQLKELRKLEKMQQHNLEQKNNTVKWVAIAIVGAIFLAIFVGVILVAKNNKNHATNALEATFEDNAYVRTAGGQGPSNPSTGSAQTSENVVTLVEYADLQCPACKSYHPVVVDLLGAYPNQLRLVFKHFPLISIHSNAMDASLAAEAAGRQGKFFEYVDQLYLVQSEWSNLPNPQEKFEEYAKKLGLDVEKFKTDMKDPALKELIEAHRSEGINNGVTGTPTFFVNGQRIGNPPNIEEFKKIIDEQLGSATSKDTTTTNQESATDKDNLQIQLQE